MTIITVCYWIITIPYKLILDHEQAISKLLTNDLLNILYLIFYIMLLGCYSKVATIPHLLTVS